MNWLLDRPLAAGDDTQVMQLLPDASLAEEVHHVGCIESSRALPRPRGGVSPPRGDWLRNRHSKPLSADGRALRHTRRSRGAEHTRIRRLEHHLEKWGTDLVKNQGPPQKRRRSK